MTSVEMKVAATEGRRRDFEDGVGWFLDFGIWAVFDDDLYQTTVISIRSSLQSTKVVTCIVIPLKHHRSHLLGRLKRHDVSKSAGPEMLLDGRP